MSDDLFLKKYLLSISYEGKNFNGFQSQLDGNAVQDHLEKNLTIFLRQETKVQGASRTDSGVHAFGQKACFKAKFIPDFGRFLAGVNALLPREIGVNSIQEVSDDFHPIRRAKAKVYRYTLWHGRCYNPFLFPYVWSVPVGLDLKLLEKSISSFEGSYDFTSFCNTDTSVKTKVRTILETRVVRHKNSVDLWFLGEGFLKQMIRIMVGTLVDLSLGKDLVGSIEEILKERNREKAGQTAPPQGLSLVEIFYDSPPRLTSFIEENEKEALLFR